MQSAIIQPGRRGRKSRARAAAVTSGRGAPRYPALPGASTPPAVTAAEVVGGAGRAPRARVRAGAPRAGCARALALGREPAEAGVGAGGGPACPRGARRPPGDPGPARRPRAARPRRAPRRGGPPRLRALPARRVAALAGGGGDRRRAPGGSAARGGGRRAPGDGGGVRAGGRRRGSRGRARPPRARSSRSRGWCARAPATRSTPSSGTWPLCLAAFQGRALVSLRSRRRDRSAGEGVRLRDEAVRAAGPGGGGAFPSRLVVSGSGSTGLRHELNGDAAGRGLEGPAEWPEAREAAWLGSLVS